MAFRENKSLSQHVNEDHSVQVASPRQCRQRYGIETQTFKNQRDLTLLLVSVRCSVLGSLALLCKHLLRRPQLRGEWIASLALPLPTESIPNTLLTNFLPGSSLQLENG